MSRKIMTSESFNDVKSNVQSILSTNVESNNVFLSAYSKKNLATHLSITTIRIQNKNYIPLSKAKVLEYQEDELYPIAKKICDAIATEYGIEFPENEISLVTMYLRKTNALDLEITTGIDLLDDQTYDYLKVSLQRIKELYNNEIFANQKFIVAIGLHLEPALERLAEGRQVSNPLTAQIKERHPIEFEYASVIRDVVKEDLNLEFNDDEVAFLALHFAVVTAKQK